MLLEIENQEAVLLRRLAQQYKSTLLESSFELKLTESKIKKIEDNCQHNFVQTSVFILDIVTCTKCGKTDEL